MIQIKNASTINKIKSNNDENNINNNIKMFLNFLNTNYKNLVDDDKYWNNIKYENMDEHFPNLLFLNNMFYLYKKQNHRQQDQEFEMDICCITTILL